MTHVKHTAASAVYPVVHTCFGCAISSVLGSWHSVCTSTIHIEDVTPTILLMHDLHGGSGAQKGACHVCAHNSLKLLRRGVNEGLPPGKRLTSEPQERKAEQTS